MTRNLAATETTPTGYRAPTWTLDPEVGANLNGTNVIYTADGSTIFVPLPRRLWREIKGGCSCKFCSAVEGRKAYWDTLAIAAKPRKGRATDTAWTVHHPTIGSYRLGERETESGVDGNQNQG